MELKYIWIEDYKNLKKIGFNFNHSENEKFEYKNEELKIFESEENTPLGFFGDSILGVTGIVGKNGSGKTNLAEFVNYNLAHVSNHGLSTFGLNNKGIIILGKRIFIHKSIVVKNKQELKNKGYTESYYDKAPLDGGNGEMRWHSMEKNRYIYFNPSFDFRMIQVRSNLSNISTSYLAFNDLYHFLKHYIENDRTFNKTKTDSLYAHFRNEKIRESNFIINYENEMKRLVGHLPTKMIISIDHRINNRLLHFRYITKDELDSDPKKKLLNKNQRDLNDLENEISSLYGIEEYKVDEPKLTGYDVYKIEPNYKKAQFKKLFFIQLFKILLIDNEFPNGEFANFIFNNEIKIDDKALTRLLYKLSELLDELIELGIWEIEFEKLSRHDFGDYDERELKLHTLFALLQINIDTENKKKLLNEIITITNELTNHRLHFHYEFDHKMSSGQQNLVNFFSRLLWAKQNINLRESLEEATKSERIILFIDEGEITFHPEWQRRYFNEAISFVKKLFTERKIQLLITTHSPFVLSDLPKQNVIFLEKDGKGNAIKSKLEKENTFGANIHDLLSNSFFMDASIGEFVSDRIKEVVEFYYKVVDAKSEKSRKALNEEYISIRHKFHFIVESMGDDVIKGILENHIEFIENKLIGKSYREIRIAKLEKEINKLKSKK